MQSVWIFFDNAVQVVNLISTLIITSSFKLVNVFIDRKMRTKEAMKLETKQAENQILSHLGVFLLQYNLQVCSSWKTGISLPGHGDVYIKITSCSIYSKVLNRWSSFFKRYFTKNILNLLYLQKNFNILKSIFITGLIFMVPRFCELKVKQFKLYLILEY